MADRQISSLPQAQTVDDDSLFVLEQQGVAMKASGAQWKGYAQDAVRQYVTQAQQQAQAAASSATQAANSATAAAASASDAEEAVTQIGTAVDDTLANVQAAQAAQEAAEAAQEAAETAADGVEAFVTEAESARDAAIAAQQAAETAEWNAETSATGAATSASQASQSASDASGSATDAAGSATTATQAASDAQAAQLLAETAKTGAEAAEDGAEAARDAILNMIVKAITLETGQPATVSKELVNGIFQLTFGLPKGNTGKTGAQGIQGVSIESIQLTSGNHAPGTTDTYTIALSNDTTYTFSVYNGANGTGTGDFMASGIVPMTGNLQMGGNRVTGMAAPTADTDGATKGYVDKGLSNKQDTLSGTEDQLVGFNSAGEATAVPKPTAADVGALPTQTGTQGQVLGFTADNTVGAMDAPSGLPDGGTEGQILEKTADSAAWTDKPLGSPARMNILETICENVTLSDESPSYTFPEAITLDSDAEYLLIYTEYESGETIIDDTIRALSKVDGDSVNWISASPAVVMTTTEITDNWRSSGNTSTFSIYKASTEVTDNVNFVAVNREGFKTFASGSCSHAEGYQTTASGTTSHAEGYKTTASGKRSHAEGYQTTASGIRSHAEGEYTDASGACAHAEGRDSVASGDYSHAEGYYTEATGIRTHAEGSYSTAAGDYSHAEGHLSNAMSPYQHVQGKCNIEDSSGTYAHIVGNGESNKNRSNAHTLDWDGNAWFAGEVYAGGESQSDGDKLAKEKNVVPNTRTINSKPLSSNVTLTAEDVGAIANPNSGTTGQILTKTENGVKWADPPSGGTASYVASFTAEQWTAGTGESTITIPAATHKLSGSIVDCKAFASISGGYRAGVWASLETYATVAENGDIVLHYPDTSGYAGAAVLTAYEIPS